MKNLEYKGMFQCKSFSVHFADDWLHIDRKGSMMSIKMFGEEKLRFIQFLEDRKEYTTQSGVNIFYEEDGPEEPRQIVFDVNGILYMLFIKHEQQWARLKRRLTECVNRHSVTENDNGIFVSTEDHNYGPYVSYEVAEKDCKLRNGLLPMSEYDSLPPKFGWVT